MRDGPDAWRLAGNVRIGTGVIAPAAWGLEALEYSIYPPDRVRASRAFGSLMVACVIFSDLSVV